jgi:carbonic anhydrase
LVVRRIACTGPTTLPDSFLTHALLHSTGSCSVSTDDAAYDLLQFHVHTPSEHTLNGKALDGEAHFVHSNEDSSALLVVGLFFQASDDAETDPFFTGLLDGIDAVTEETPANITLYAAHPFVRL